MAMLPRGQPQQGPPGPTGPAGPPGPAGSAGPPGPDLTARVAALEQQVTALDARVTVLEGGTTPPVEPPIEPPIEPPSGGLVRDFVADFGAVEGQDCTAAFNRWIEFAQANRGSTLLIPAGKFISQPTIPNTGAFVPSHGCLDSWIIGVPGDPGQPPRTILSCPTHPMTAGSKDTISFNFDYTARFAEVSAGAVSLTLLTAADAAKFKVDQLVMVTGLTLMPWGWPPNPENVEYHRITAINGNVLTLAKPLRFSYKTEWPHFTNPPGDDYLGPATLVSLHPYHDASYSYQHLLFELGGGWSGTGEMFTGAGRSFLFDDCSVAVGNRGAAPSMCERYEWRNSVQIGTDPEVDKLVGELFFTNINSPGTSILVQSASVMAMQVTDCHLRGMIGTPRNSTIKNTAFDWLLKLGAGFYGLCDTAVLENVTTHMSGVDWGVSWANIQLPFWHSVFRNGSFVTTKTQILSSAGDSAERDGVARWLPGRKYAYSLYTGSAILVADDGRIHGFTVTAVREEGDNYIVDTDMAAEPSPLPTFNGGQPPTHYYGFPLQQSFTESGNSESWEAQKSLLVPPASLVP